MVVPLLCLCLLVGDAAATIMLKELLTLRNSSNSSFLNVQGLAFLEDGAVVVTDKLDYRIKKVSRNGAFLGESGNRGSRAGEFRGPGPIDCYQDKIAVADFASSRVQIFSADLRYRGMFRAPGPVSDLKFDRTGGLWLATVTGDRDRVLFKCDSSGNVQKTVSLRNTCGDEFQDVIRLAVTEDNWIVVAYYAQNRIELCDKTGSVVRDFCVPGLPAAPKMRSIPRGFFRRDLIVPEDNIFSGLTVDRRGNIFVLAGEYTSQPRRDVYVLNIRGQLITQFTLPRVSHGIWIGNEGCLYSIENERTTIGKYSLLYRGFGGRIP